MKTYVTTLLFFLTAFLAWSQINHDWKNLKSSKIYLLEKNCSEVKPTEVTSAKPLKIDSKKLMAILKTAKTRNVDVILEEECLIVRVQFTTYTDNFVIYPEQGVIFELNGRGEYYFIDNPKHLQRLIDSSVKK